MHLIFRLIISACLLIILLLMAPYLNAQTDVNHAGFPAVLPPEYPPSEPPFILPFAEPPGPSTFRPAKDGRAMFIPFPLGAEKGTEIPLLLIGI